MGRFYSDTLEKGIRLLYFQADPSQYPRGIKLLEQAVQAEEPDAFYFLARCYAWEDGNVPEDIKKHAVFPSVELNWEAISVFWELSHSSVPVPMLLLGLGRTGEPGIGISVCKRLKRCRKKLSNRDFRNVLSLRKGRSPQL